MTTHVEFERLVRERAANRCEYCGMHQSLQGGTFHIEHVIPRSRNGLTEDANLALACPSCNLQKSNRVDVPDLETGQATCLFHPRRQHWSEHFRWDDFEIVGTTATGRATVAALRLNDERRLRIRQAEKMFDLFPPD
jgi:HNH endonuclease